MARVSACLYIELVCGRVSMPPWTERLLRGKRIEHIGYAQLQCSRHVGLSVFANHKKETPSAVAK